MTKSNYALCLQPSLKAAAERLATREGTSLNHFINIAVAEKLSALETASYLAERAKRSKRKAGTRFLDEALDEPPSEGDQLPG